MAGDVDDVAFADMECVSGVLSQVDVLVFDGVVWVGSPGDGGVSSEDVNLIVAGVEAELVIGGGVDAGAARSCDAAFSDREFDWSGVQAWFIH